MSTEVRLRQDTAANVGIYTLASGELGYKTDTKELVVGDGSTVGGITLAKKVAPETIEVTATGTTTARSLADRFGSTVNIEDFGAVGDGSDDTMAFQLALDNGGTITGDSTKTYTVGEVTIKSNTTLLGLKLKTKAGIPNNSSMLNSDSSSNNIKIICCVIDGNKSNQTESVVNAIGLSGSRHQVSNNYIFNTKGSAISLLPPFNDSTIKDNILVDLDMRGITHQLSLVTPSERVLIQGNFIRNTGNTGISLISGDDATETSSAGVIDWTIDSNVVSNTGLLTIAGSIGAYSANNLRLVVSNNRSYNIGNHGHHIGGNYCKVINNTIVDVANSGILIRNFPNNTGTGAPTNTGNVVSGNTIKNVFGLGSGSTSHNGITIANAEDFVVSSNLVNGVQNVGIKIEGLVLGRTIRSSAGTVVGNTVVNSGEASGLDGVSEGILIINSDKVSVTGNSVKTSYRSNIRVSGSENSAIVGNIVSGSVVGNGIYVVEGSPVVTRGCTVNGNTATDNNQFGIRINANIIRVACTGNASEGNSVGQFFIGSLSSSVVMSNVGRRDTNGGKTSVANGGTISHFLEGTPDKYWVIPTIANRSISVTSVSPSTLTVSVTDLSGTPVASSEQVVWGASYEITG